MDLPLFFESLPESLITDVNDREAMVRHLNVYVDEFPSLDGVSMAIVGVPDGREAGDNVGTADSPNEIRKKLYGLKRGHGTLPIVDLGNLVLGIDAEEMLVRVSEVCSYLLRKGVLPILLGGSQAVTYGQYQAYEGMEKLVSLVNVDSSLDMEQQDDLPGNKRYLQRIFTHEPNFLFQYSHVGYQSYFVHADTLAMLESLYFEAYRLGQLRDQPKDVEPVIRQADLLSFDIGAIKLSDAPGHAVAQPFGLTGEEACQICWYAGMNEKLSSVGFYEYNPVYDDDRKSTAMVVATMVWYFIEGVNHRRDKQDFSASDYLRYVVSMPSEPETLVFYKSKLSEKWWMEVPYPQRKGQYSRNVVVPCGYSDYERANYGELPDRWWQTQAKIV